MKTVTRQSQWGTGNMVVEISDGGIDYCNPDALSAKYRGEFEEFADPREAVETAITIAQQWQADAPDKTYTALREWANSQYEELEKCCRCGDILGKERWTHPELCEEEKFCSENCCDNAYWDMMKELEEEEEEEDEDEEVEDDE